MRYAEDHKQQVRERIVDAASSAIRKHGLNEVSIPAMMTSVGLTHGGFYAHFSKRDELVVEAVMAAARQSSQSLFADGVSLQEMRANYLSTQHVHSPERGCIVAALGAEGCRQSPAVQSAFAYAAVGLIQHVNQKLGNDRKDQPSDAALRQTALMVGAVLLGRMVQDQQLTDRLLAVAAHDA